MTENTSERRAVRVSHELWREILTQGYTSAGWRCIQGIPEDATIVATWNTCGWPTPNPLFLFESDQWDGPAEQWIVEIDGQKYHEQRVIFQRVECRACKHWARTSDPTEGTCSSPSAFTDALTGKGLSLTNENFGCTAYEPVGNE